jgi:hypothetical protein
MVEILNSARKHGIGDEDILHCIELALVVEEVDEDPLRYLVIGPDRSSRFLELIVMDRPNGPCVMHAMLMRAKYEQLIPKKG